MHMCIKIYIMSMKQFLLCRNIYFRFKFPEYVSIFLIKYINHVYIGLVYFLSCLCASRHLNRPCAGTKVSVICTYAPVLEHMHLSAYVHIHMATCVGLKASNMHVCTNLLLRWNETQ